MLGSDFAARLCSAAWGNNGINFPCPGDDLSNANDGYVALYGGTELGVRSGIPAILSHPAQNSFPGILGRFPGYEVRQGDQFYAHVDCLPRVVCYVRFGLDYYDESGVFHSGCALHPMHGMDPMEECVGDLGPLSGRVVQLALAVRPLSERASAYAGWIGPAILSFQTSQ